MKFFDPHIHMNARTTDDYEAMRKEGILAVCEPAFWVGQLRTSVGTYEDYLRTIIGWENFRASQFGIHHFCAIGLNPKEANNSNIADGVIELLPKFIHKKNVIAIGEIGYDDITKAEEKYLKIQLELAFEHNLPVIIHTPHRDKKKGTELTLKLIKELKLDEKRILIDHNTEETVGLVLNESNCWAGHTIYPHTKMSKERMIKIVEKYGTQRIIVDSSADWGISDPLNVPKTAKLMKERGFDENTIEKLFWKNPIEFFSQSGRLKEEDIKEPIKIDQSQLWEGNSILRGQTPQIET